MGTSWDYSSNGSRIIPAHFSDLSDNDHMNINDESELMPTDELWKGRTYREKLSDLDLTASTFVPKWLNAWMGNRNDRGEFAMYQELGAGGACNTNTPHIDSSAILAYL
jgi:hypothetical protein